MNSGRRSHSVRMMRPTRPPVRRALTLLELLLALSISALVAGSLVAMLDAVAVGTTRRGDIRSTLVVAGGITTRLNAYVTPSNALLDATEDGFVLWFNDDRSGGTVHGTEIRWFEFDESTGQLFVAWIAFPDTWSKVVRDLEDGEYTPGSDWSLVRRKYEDAGHIIESPVAEGLAGLRVLVPDDVPTASRFSVELDFTTSASAITLTPAFSIDTHRAPQ
ncbi:MAG: hypothetical protein AB8G96_00465 [Phycisphaerales bacterium]